MEFPRSLEEVYEPVRLLGKGGFAYVFKVRNRKLDRVEALKIMRKENIENDPAAVERFLSEARMAAALVHPNILPIYDVGQVDDALFFSMQFVDGETLEHTLVEQGQLIPSETRKMLASVGSALDYAHSQGVVHRDVKPANIIFNRATGQYMLMDFGIAKREGSSKLTQTGTFVGTVEYSSPEQLKGLPVGPATDVYALGIMLYECYAGQTPFHSNSAAEVIYGQMAQALPPSTSIPDQVFSVLCRATHKDPQNRFPTCGELFHALFGDAPPTLSCPETVSIPSGAVRIPTSDSKVASRSAVTQQTGGKSWAIAAILGGGALVTVGILGVGAYFLLGPGSKPSGAEKQAATSNIQVGLQTQASDPAHGLTAKPNLDSTAITDANRDHPQDVSGAIIPVEPDSRSKKMPPVAPPAASSPPPVVLLGPTPEDRAAISHFIEATEAARQILNQGDVVTFQSKLNDAEQAYRDLSDRARSSTEVRQNYSKLQELSQDFSRVQREENIRRETESRIKREGWERDYNFADQRFQEGELGGARDSVNRLLADAGIPQDIRDRATELKRQIEEAIAQKMKGIHAGPPKTTVGH
jgi:serine/threonine protein kinase